MSACGVLDKRIGRYLSGSVSGNRFGLRIKAMCDVCLIARYLAPVSTVLTEEALLAQPGDSYQVSPIPMSNGVEYRRMA